MPAPSPAAASPSPVPGIAIATYGRRERVERLVAELRQLTGLPFELVVADDGSEDGTAEWCRAHEVRVVTGANRGVAWNKNRGLFALSLLDCDPLILIEDDILPLASGWEREWIEATRRWHHVGFLHPKIAPYTVSGSGTADDPFRNEKATAQCLSVSAAVLGQVGFFDSRFVGWGHEHAEWTSRIKRMARGPAQPGPGDGRADRDLYYITGGLRADDAPSYRDNEAARANMATYRRIAGDRPFRYPWRDEAEREAFLGEQRAAGLLAGRGVSPLPILLRGPSSGGPPARGRPAT